VVPFDLQGTSDVRYLPGGLEADFLIPERHLAPESAGDDGPDRTILAETPESSLPLRALRPLEGLKVLLLEDNLIVALEAEDLLSGLGAAAVFAASTVEAGLKILEGESLGFAVLDINLGFETSLDFAVALRAARIPYIFASGYGESRIIDAMHESVITLSKPYDRENLARAIAHTLARHESGASTRPG
jgi:CheY-like chemotaxis protein